jgi:Cd2+/Zn2+-exporting ATPase
MSNGDNQINMPFHVSAGKGDETSCIVLMESALRGMKGVQGLELDMPGGRLILRYDPAVTSLARVQVVAQQLGVELGNRYRTCTLRLEGVRCDECALRLEADLTQIPGVAGVHVNPAAQVIGVEYDAAQTGTRTFVERIAGSGFIARPQPRSRADLKAAHALEDAARRRMAALSLLCLGALLAAALAEWMNLLAAPGVLLIYAVSYFAGGLIATQRALRELRARSINVDLLMIVAALGAAAVREYPEGAVLLFLFSFSSTLEQYVLGYTRRSIEALMNLTPEDALVRRAGVEQRVPVEQLRVGDVLIVRPAERIAADGEIVTGRTSVDQSAMTGESIPVDKAIGDPVFAATLNQQGAIEVRVTHMAGETMLARIVQLVEEAQSVKARSQRFTDWFGARYTVGVLFVSALTLLVPLVVLHEPFAEAFYRAMTVLVVASPCAVVISIPAAILAAITSAARGGVLFKGGAALEQLARVRAIAFDKTGTLTLGRPQLADLVASDDITPAELLELAASAEALSEHPLAKAVMDAARARGLTLQYASHLEALVGRGVRAQVGTRQVLIGKRELFESIPESLLAASLKLAHDGKTVVFVGDELHALGLLAIADSLRASAPDAMRELGGLGLKRLIMLTGDHEIVAQTIAGSLGIAYAAQLMPEDKLKIVQELRAQYKTVAMVGDGINDAPSLASADVGISIGGTGTDVALETADVVLMAGDLRHLPYAIRLSRAANRIIGQNLGFAFGMMILLLASTFLAPVLSGGALSLRLPLAVVGHEGSTVLVILNGLRLLAFPRPARHDP